MDLYGVIDSAINNKYDTTYGYIEPTKVGCIGIFIKDINTEYDMDGESSTVANVVLQLQPDTNTQAIYDGLAFLDMVAISPDMGSNFDSIIVTPAQHMGRNEHGVAILHKKIKLIKAYRG